MRMTGSWRVYPADRPSARRAAGWSRSSGRSARSPRASPRRSWSCSTTARYDAIRSSRARTGSLPARSRHGRDRAPLSTGSTRTRVGVALLDQRVAAGIGNVYKSEAAFACRDGPVHAARRRLDREQRAHLWRTAGELLRRNLGRRPRRTTPHGLAVYDRAGRPCRVCGTPIAVRRQGEDARSTWWCPACQPPTPAVHDGAAAAERAT